MSSHGICARQVVGQREYLAEPKQQESPWGARLVGHDPQPFSGQEAVSRMCECQVKSTGKTSTQAGFPTWSPLTVFPMCWGSPKSRRPEAAFLSGWHTGLHQEKYTCGRRCWYLSCCPGLIPHRSLLCVGKRHLQASAALPRGIGRCLGLGHLHQPPSSKYGAF